MKSLYNFIPTHIVEAIGGSLMHSLWQLAAIGLLLIAILALLPQGAAKLRYWFAVGAMGLMLAMPFATFGFLYEAPAEVATTHFDAATATAMARTFHFAKTQTAIPQTLSAQIGGFFQENASLLFGLWLLGVAFFSARFLGSIWQVRRLRKSGIHAVPEALAERFTVLLEQVGIGRTVQLAYSKKVDTPMVLGVLKPIVLLPMGLLSGLSMAQVECILIHELGHVRRWDYLVNILQCIAEIILFYHPATWWMSKIIRQERENCCDELVVQLKSDKVQYAQALLNLEVLRQQRPQLAMAAKGGDLMQRIQRITGVKTPQKRRFNGRGLLFGLLTFACIALVASQSHSVIKAAMPFLLPDSPKTLDDFPPQNDTKTGSKSEQFKAKAGNFQLVSTAQDTPTTKVILNENGNEIELEFAEDGTITKAMRNGKAIPEAELAPYSGLAQSFFRGMPPSPNGSGNMMPPLPPLPQIGNLPPLPPLPVLDDFPPMPIKPIAGKNADPAAYDREMKRYTQEMDQWGKRFGKHIEGQDWEAYGKKMEAWGEQYGKQFDNLDWEAYGKKMEKWGQEFEKQIEAQDWEGFGEKMEAWGESFAKTFESQDFDKLGKDIEVLVKNFGPADALDNSPEHQELIGEMDRVQKEITKASNATKKMQLEAELKELEARMGELHGKSFEIHMEEFGSQMEEFGKEMEKWAENFEREIEVERLEDEANTARLDKEAKHEAATIDRGQEKITQALLADGLIQNAASYELRISKKALLIDGKQQSDALHQKYMQLLHDVLDVEIGKEVVIRHKRK